MLYRLINVVLALVALYTIAKLLPRKADPEEVLVTALVIIIAVLYLFSALSALFRAFLIALILIIPAPAPSQAGMINQAYRYIGMHERSIHFLSVNPRTTQWCGEFLAHVAKLSKRKPPHHPRMAKSWRKFGKPVSLRSSRRGDVVVLRIKGSYHAGLLYSFNARKNTVKLLGGNQADRVKISTFRASSIVAIRR